MRFEYALKKVVTLEWIESCIILSVTTVTYVAQRLALLWHRMPTKSRSAMRTTSKLNRVLPYIFIVASVVGLAASFALTYDKIHVIENPQYQPACNINPILSCGSVMKTQQATLFGVPNTIFGLVAFAMLGVVGVVIASGALLQRWIWRSLWASTALGMVFMHYLFFESVFRIHAICPWCFSVWMATIAVFWPLSTYMLRHHVTEPRAWGIRHVYKAVRDHPLDVLALWYLLILGTLLVKFWYYWRTLLP